MFDYFIMELNSLSSKLSGGSNIGNGIVTVWLLTTAMVLMRRVPYRIYRLLKSKLVAKTRINNYTGPNSVDDRNLRAFLKFFDGLPTSKYDRNRRILFEKGSHVSVPAPGNHWFIFDGRFFWFTYREIESNGVEYQKEVVTIYTFSSSAKIFGKLVDQFILKPKPNDVSFYGYGNGIRKSWSLEHKVDSTKIPEPIINKDLEDAIFTPLNRFINDPEWFRSRDLPHKLTYLFSGEPGTGKTTLARLMGLMTGTNIYRVDLAILTDKEFLDAIREMHGRSILILDDFDIASGTAKRTKVDSEDKPRASRGVSLSTLLSVLDGVVPLNDIVIVMTTNYPEHIDSAVLRPGRVDISLEITKLDSLSVEKWFKRMYCGKSVTNPLPAKVTDLLNIFHSFPEDFESAEKEYLKLVNFKEPEESDADHVYKIE